MTQVKQTSIGRRAEEWEVTKISDLFIVETGTTPSTKKREYWDNGTINWFTPTDLSQLTGKVCINSSARKITRKAVADTNLTVMPKGAIVISTRAPVGYVAMLEKEGTFNQGCKGLIPRDFIKTHSLFYCYHLLSLKSALQNLSGGSTFKELSKKTLDSLRVPLPPLPEQKAIAQVLSSVDEGIQKVDEIIAKTDRLKKGLMQKLLTKGIGHKEFKDTEIGRIPKEWEVVELEDAVEINKESRDPTRESPNTKFLYIDIESIEGGTGVIKAVKEIVGKDAPSRARRVVKHNDIMMSTVRPYLKAFALVPEEYDNQICSTGFAVLSCRERVLSLYLLYTLFSKTTIDQCNKMMVGGQYPALNQSQVARIKLPLPPIAEQREIAEILSTTDKKLELERKRKEKLERIKKGLMNDLLTGRKRVKIGDQKW